jgi:hypothetical protein
MVAECIVEFVGGGESRPRVASRKDVLTTGEHEKRAVAVGRAVLNSDEIAAGPSELDVAKLKRGQRGAVEGVRLHETDILRI